MSRPDDDGGGFLGRWAKRKQAVRLEAEQQPSQPLKPNTPDIIPEEKQLPMPSLDQVLPGGDVSMFLQKHVPDSLRNMALRKAWATDPEISGFIEMAENQWDFNNPDSIPGFSSSLEGVDLKVMVERVFNNVAPPKQEELADVEIEADLSENEPPKELSETTNNIIMDTKYEEKPEILSTNRHKTHETEIHGAVQENTVKSGVYETIKKRHGSALPS